MPHGGSHAQTGGRDILAGLRGATTAAQSLGRQKVAAEEIERREDQQALENARAVTAQLLRERQVNEQVTQFGVVREFEEEREETRAGEFGEAQQLREDQLALDRTRFDAAIQAQSVQSTGLPITDVRTQRFDNVFREGLGLEPSFTIEKDAPEGVVVEAGSQLGILASGLRKPFTVNVGSLDPTPEAGEFKTRISQIKKKGDIEALVTWTQQNMLNGKFDIEDIPVIQKAINDVQRDFKLSETSLPIEFAVGEQLARGLGTLIIPGFKLKFGAKAIKALPEAMKLLTAGKNITAAKAQAASGFIANTLSKVSVSVRNKLFSKFPALKRLAGQAPKQLGPGAVVTPPPGVAGLLPAGTTRNLGILSSLGAAGVGAAALTPDITEAAQPGSVLDQIISPEPKASLLPFARTPSSVVINGADIKIPVISNQEGAQAVANIHNNPTPQAVAKAMTDVEASFQRNPLAWDETELNETLSFLGSVRLEQTLAAGTPLE